ncbi:MAG: hypothetical protein HLUCCA08_00705 [Rhodobacteraceae bacterium HLUCCA08]|nr:MAG: hypothetical protein HLUCCA08_00705 [Rhodobacteraceae bacterium HLUCCA08]
MDRRGFLIGAPLALAACGSGEYAWAPDDVVQRAAYVHPGPPALTLFTMKNTGTDNGAHTGLMINASQRVIFDPAGTFGHPSIPERNDVHYGITPRIADFYVSYHSRITYYTVIQHLEVSAEAAEMALRGVEAAGPVAKARCTTDTSAVLRRLPGLESLRTTWFPDNLMRQFAALPGVRQREHRETDSDDKSEALAEFDSFVSLSPSP